MPHLIRMRWDIGFECFETRRAQGCEGIPPFKVGCLYVCDAWDAESPKAVADMRSLMVQRGEGGEEAGLN